MAYHAAHQAPATMACHAAHQALLPWHATMVRCCYGVYRGSAQKYFFLVLPYGTLVQCLTAVPPKMSKYRKVNLD